jgi:hypothetical protein
MDARTMRESGERGLRTTSVLELRYTRERIAC